MKFSAKTHTGHLNQRSFDSVAALTLTVAALTFLICVSSASASKQVDAYFGTEVGSGSLGGEFNFPGDVAVNGGGSGPAEKGDIYVIDQGNHRIQRFAQDDNGTPANPYDDTFPFVSAWGADVDSSSASGGNYEVCTIAANCKAGVASGGNGTVAGDGAFGAEGPSGIAVDEDTGLVYVSDHSNHRVNVFEGDGTFVRSFGFDVVASGPDNNGTGYEVCVAANGDVCKAGLASAGAGGISGGEGIAVSSPDGNPTTGTVFVADRGNQRVDTYNLDGSSPSSFGSSVDFGSSAVESIAVDSRGIVYVEARDVGGGQIDRYDSQNADGGGVGFLAPISVPPLLAMTKAGNGTTGNGTIGMEVDPDSDGAGPETDVLYVLRNISDGPDTVVQQFGPLNPPGLTAPPMAADDNEIGSAIGFNYVDGLGLDESSGRLFIDTFSNVGSPYIGGGVGNHRVFALDEAGGTPTATLDSLSDITATTVTLHGTVDPNGPPDLKFHFEYSTDGTTWKSVPDTVVGSQEAPQAVSATLNPLPVGLQPNTSYHVRVVASKPFATPVVTSELTFTTLAEKPTVETTGSPVRTAATARLEGRVNPRGSASTYYFEYGDQGPCGENPCESSQPRPAGSGDEVELVSKLVGGLEPNTTYHYRVVAENAAPRSPSFGKDMTVTTRESDTPLTHGHLLGPPDSDRGYEQITLPDSGGNPTVGAQAISDDGERVIYQVFGGNPLSSTGNAFNQFYAERTPFGWQTKDIYPRREELVASGWIGLGGRSDLSDVVSLNFAGGIGDLAAFRMSPNSSASKVYQVPGADYGGLFGLSDDGSRVVMLLKGPQDPAHPVAGGELYLYDVSSGVPKMISLLPDGTVPACDIHSSSSAYDLPQNLLPRALHWISADGSRVFFPSHGDNCTSPSQLYMRDVGTGETKLLSGPPVSGPSCGAAYIRSTPGAVFFWTKSRLNPADTLASDGCADTSIDGDVYRYDIGDGSLQCVTCVTAGIDADVWTSLGSEAANDIAVAPDGSRVYFKSAKVLVSGAAPSGQEGAATGVYRVDVADGSLAYLGRINGQVGTGEGNAINPDGSVLIFSSSTTGLNALGGQQNGGTAQYYRYDDNDRSLVCVSCPQDGSTPVGPVKAGNLVTDQYLTGPNLSPLSDGGTFAFATSTPLVGADQNTVGPGQEPRIGTDIYEWRDGRLLLVTDGLIDWPVSESVVQTPEVSGVSRSGKDIYFVAAARYTPDALDDYARLYDARIGGGFEFPASAKPCPLEVCQGTPEGAPEERLPGSADFSGPGNAHPSAIHKRKHRKHGKHRKQRRTHRVKHRRGRAR